MTITKNASIPIWINGWQILTPRIQKPNNNALSDLYVKAIRWASDRIKDEGIVAYVTNNSFIDGYAFDGMRKHLEKDFQSHLYS